MPITRSHMKWPCHAPPLIKRLTLRKYRRQPRHHTHRSHHPTHLSHLPRTPLLSVSQAARTYNYDNTSHSLGGPPSTGFMQSAPRLIRIAVYVTNGWLTPPSSRFISSASTADLWERYNADTTQACELLRAVMTSPCNLLPPRCRPPQPPC